VFTRDIITSNPLSSETDHPVELADIMQTIKVFFDEPNQFEMRNIRHLMGITGLYFIFLANTVIQYPFGQSSLIYIGMSEKKSNSIGSRLAGHLDGRSGNVGILNYARFYQAFFTYLNFQMLRRMWPYKVEDLESYFIADFVKRYGVHPICNNKTSLEISQKDLDVDLIIDWTYFEQRRVQQ